MSEPLYRLYLVRHGATEWSETHRHTGLTDVALNADGEQQARELGEYLKSLEFAGVFTSPLQRARRTCELAGFGASAESDRDLLEWDYGDYEGQTTSALRQQHPGWNVFTHDCPNGETLNDVKLRADRFIHKVRSIPGNVIAFSSGHIIRVITARWLSLEPEAGRFFMASTAAINILGYEHDRNEPVICLWNE
ncbi:MAG: histidine phosphatase family protein [Gammaproteobacteria bacterium]|jgi:broad specificity phosphatase PhoE